MLLQVLKLAATKTEAIVTFFLLFLIFISILLLYARLPMFRPMLGKFLFTKKVERIQDTGE